jgi:hypothetical protein
MSQLTNIDRTQDHAKDPTVNQGFDGEQEGGEDNVKFGRRKLPILDLMFDDFMRQEGDKTTERYEKWLFKTLLTLRKNAAAD